MMMMQKDVDFISVRWRSVAKARLTDLRVEAAWYESRITAGFAADSEVITEEERLDVRLGLLRLRPRRAR